MWGYGYEKNLDLVNIKFIITKDLFHLMNDNDDWAEQEYGLHLEIPAPVLREMACSVLLFPSNIDFSPVYLFFPVILISIHSVSPFCNLDFHPIFFAFF